MSRDTGDVPRKSRWYPRNPWPFLLAAGGTVLLALLLQATAPSWVAVRALLLFAGMVLAMGAAGLRLRNSSEDVEERFRCAGFLALVAAVPFLGGLALDTEWDSAGLLLGVGCGVALVGAILLMLPRVARRLTLTALVLFHFAGILSAVCSVAPPGRPGSWMANKAWSHVFRPYLQFMYLNNAYHFYSPEPGPPILLWFRIQYEDGSARWVDLPSHKEAQVRLAFQRRLALTDSTNTIDSRVPNDINWLTQKRAEAGEKSKVPMLPTSQESLYLQRKPPVPIGKRLLRSYARYVANHFPSEENPELPVKSVKVYRVKHDMLWPAQLAGGMDPYDPRLYEIHFMGEFDPEGRLLKKNGKDDPFLYWLIPTTVDVVPDSLVSGRKEDVRYRITEYLPVHAGDSDKPTVTIRP
jgi:hypothetical protein